MNGLKINGDVSGLSIPGTTIFDQMAEATDNSKIIKSLEEIKKHVNDTSYLNKLQKEWNSAGKSVQKTIRNMGSEMSEFCDDVADGGELAASSVRA